MVQPLRLRIVEPDASGPREVDLTDGLVVGRSSKASLTIADPFVSGHHVRFMARGDQFVAEHIGGGNGTQIVDGPLLSKGDVHQLQPGTKISLGETRIEVIGAGAPDSATVVGPVGPGGGGDDDGTVIGDLSPGVAGDGTVFGDVGPQADSDVGDKTVLGAVGPASRQAPPPAPATPPPAPVAESAPAPALESAPAPQPRSTAQPQQPQPSQQRPPSAEPTTQFEQTIMHRTGAMDPLALAAMLQKASPRLVFSNDVLHEIVDVVHPQFTIGRNPKLSHHRVIDHPTISGTHARINFEGGRFFLEDLGSTNHTYLYAGDRKEQLTANAPRELSSDSRIVFGGVEAMFVIDFDAETRAIDRSKHFGAVRFLQGQKRFSDQQGSLATRTAGEAGRHVGEILIRDRLITIGQWLEAIELSKADEMVGKSMSSMKVVVSMLVIVVLGLTAAVIYFMFFKEQPL